MSSHFLDGIWSQILTKHVAQPNKHRMNNDKAPKTNIITVGDPNRENATVHVFLPNYFHNDFWEIFTLYNMPIVWKTKTISFSVVTSQNLYISIYT